VPDHAYPKDVFVGDLRREFTLTAEDEWILDAPGGSLLYASGGYLVWETEQGPGILTRVGEDYPEIWLDQFTARGVDIRGVVVLPRSMDLRSCTFLERNSVQSTKNPLGYISKRNVSLPKDLIGYANHLSNISNRRERWETAIREIDIPTVYESASGAHICPLDYLSHNLLPAVLRNKGFSIITLDPCSSYMVPDFFGDFPSLVTGLTAIMPSEEDLRNLYKGKAVDLWEIAGDLGRYGCDLVIIKRGSAGQYLYDSASRRKWEIPAYPARVVNPKGAGNAFCGGFLAGFRRNYDPLEGVLYGNVSASLAVEGHGVFFALDALPGLANARLEALRDGVREV
jgi:sugar/nucleoside kinase (ribokinase family)